MYRTVVGVLFVGALVFMGGCAQAPQEAIDAANQALDTARTAEAADYAPEEWQMAQDAFNSAMTEVQAQNDKFALVRSYSEAAQLLEKATEAAKTAATEASSAREEVKARAEALLQEAEAALTAATAALETAPKGKGTEADLMAMKAEIETMTASLASARESFAAGKYLMAETSAQSVRDQAKAIAEDIAQAQTKKSAT
ncbi:MAG TPA: hypothetical protein VEK15_15040 [Vicinamibacteria bacterium]|nr:hypothetical protein [Vicinamibacteria bacterium]